jgi:3-dehydroquinate synthase
LNIIYIKSFFGKYTVNFVTVNSYFFRKNSRNAFFIIDSKVYRKNKIFKKITSKKIIIKSSENAKSYNEISLIIKKLIDINIDKNSEIFAVGGGVIQDIASFASSIIFRGIKWNFIPTTIISQCDSCIGGKTSVNFLNLKNQLGNFYPPKKIYLDINFIKTLSYLEIKSGLGEMMHYFLVSNKNNWTFFKRNIDTFLNKKYNSYLLKKIILKSLKIKKFFIEKDEFDKKERLILNYGHTFGHALEKISNYTMPHGLAVAHGMNIANYFSLQLNFINLKVFNDIENIINKLIVTSDIKNINIKDFFLALKKDKKIKNNKIRIVLTKGCGKMFLLSLNDTIILNLLKKYFFYLNSKGNS